MSAKVLIVDDSALARRNARRILENAGYDIIEADDGLGALEQYYVHHPSVVILDLVMKGMYGLDVLTKLREIDPQARVIVVSADVQNSSRQLVESGGGLGFLTKPIDSEVLLNTVQRALEGPGE
jgi:two-component system chemotaxis response regulator CheY